MQMSNVVTGVILAGGKSIRMGQDKALITVGGIRLFDYVYNTCRRIFSNLIIVTNRPENFSSYNAIITQDLFPNTGSLGGLYTGLVRSSTPYVFCTACDMPFLNPAVITLLLENIGTYDVIIPITKNGLEPLHAIYGKNCIKTIKRKIDLGKYKITDMLSELKVCYIHEEEILKLDPTLSSFFNVNTSADLMAIEEMLSKNNV